MVPPRFQAPPASRQNLLANAGVDLLIHADQRVDYAPRHALNCDPSSRPMPMIPAAVLEHCCGFLRRIWNHSGRCASWLLYLDLARNELCPFLPPQLCGPTDVRCNCTFPACPLPAPTHRLAGSITSCPHTDAEELAGRLPVFDGIHVFVAPQFWTQLSAFIVAGARPHLVPPRYVVLEDLSPEDLLLAQRLYLIDRL